MKESYVKFKGKGRKERIVPLTDYTKELIEKYLEIRKPKIKTNILFINNRGNPLGSRGIQKNLRKYMKAAGIYRKGLSVHSLRHTCLTLLMKEGVNIKVLKEIAGHENISTTEIYTHLSSEELVKSMDKHPLG